MPFVVDASIAAAWFLADENDPLLDGLMEDLILSAGRAPSLFWFEVRNLFLVAERRGRFAPGGAGASMARLRKLNIIDEGSGSDAMILSLAARHDLSAYNSAYLALAVRTSRPLATKEKRLAAAARKEGISLVGPLSRP